MGYSGELTLPLSTSGMTLPESITRGRRVFGLATTRSLSSTDTNVRIKSRNAAAALWT